MSRVVAKQVIKETLHDTLIEMGILPEYSAGGEEDILPDVAMSEGGLPIVPAVETSIDPVLAIKMKELDLEIKRQERETLLVKLRVKKQRPIVIFDCKSLNIRKRKISLYLCPVHKALLLALHPTPHLRYLRIHMKLMLV